MKKLHSSFNEIWEQYQCSADLLDYFILFAIHQLEAKTFSMLTSCGELIVDNSSFFNYLSFTLSLAFIMNSKKKVS